MLRDVTCISLEALVGEVAKIKVQGYRFVTLSVVERDADTFDIFYHFDKDLTLRHFKISVSKGVSVASITPVYLAAFLVENEMQDLFGIRFDGLVVDYERTLYLEPETKLTPLCRCTVIRAPGVESIPDPATVPTDS
jgi:NADH:ubiquinone oxidoreductase subunit C